MSLFPWTSAEETALASHLAQSVAEHLSGRAEAECARNTPRDVYFVGNLRPLSPPGPDDPGASARNELRSKLAPMAFGMDFSVWPDDGLMEAKVSLSWSVYYRIFPTWAEQRRYQVERSALWTVAAHDTSDEAEERIPVQETAELESDDTDTEEVSADEPDLGTTRDRRVTRRSSDTLFSRWRKIPCRAGAPLRAHRVDDGRWAVDTSALAQAVREELQRAAAVVQSDPEAMRARAAATRVNVPDDALLSEATYRAFLADLRLPVLPVWAWEIEGEASDGGDASGSARLSLMFANASPEAQQEDPNVEPFLFDVESEVVFSRGLAMPFRLEMAPRDFRYDPNMPARGFNCAVEPVDERGGTFRTTMWPVYSQMRYATRNTPSARFADLSADPVPVLQAIASAMRASLAEWDEAEREFRQNVEWAARHAAAFADDRSRFDDEILRFEAGVALIRTHPDVMTAFRLTNEVFRRLGNDPQRPKESWRLFQIVFVVTQIPGMAELGGEGVPGMGGEREMVDIVYFPTGGGKTEAYLGVIVFHCLFDRLRGKRAGVTAWTRFPLRLLTLQQTQRMADVIGVAELVRSAHPDPRLSGAGVDPFAVGYFVGKAGSPNELVVPRRGGGAPDEQAVWSKANDAAARQDWKRVARCPSCRTATVVVDFDVNLVRVLHRCTNEGCAFRGGTLPVYVVDNDAFRYLPSVIVGTIDKLAGLGNQRKISQLFGYVTGICTDHGYLSGKCCQKGCTQTRRLAAPAGLSGPTLFVQDELHLLKEGLGTFDAHYETFAQRLLTRFGQAQPLKIIASSATIEAFERQVEHLYGRPRERARIFPGPGPRAGESFYARTLDHPQRLYVGLIPHNKTIFNAVLELLERYHREVARLVALPAGTANPYGGEVAPGTSEWARLLDLYQTSLTYFNANRELDSFRTDIEGDVNPTLDADGVGRLTVYGMTGSTTTDEVSVTLEHLETAHPGTQDAVLATNMISHGVDVDRLNAMIFYGMPRQNAEYIQASSRVGRTYVGLVFVCLHPARERDRSHFSYFSKYHEFVGKLVEPVAINRWAKFSVERTLPGLFMATLLQVIANGSGAANPNSFYFLNTLKQRITDGRLQRDQFTRLLEDAYLVSNPSNATEEAVRSEIRQRIELYLNQIVASDGTKTFVSEAIRPKPLTSLREVDETIPIDLDADGASWARAAARL